MSYKVFARKWRPLNFAQVVGQEHVVRALVNGLENERLHHAYLFTGTRGVGKTTIARVLAKALNCPNAVAAEPCGQCDTCLDVDQGCYPDLIEVDAASRTGVDDTRDLLENVQYSPSRGKYKVYLIDEVHMFSKSSFNALLKTLEEPPEHVKFLLATTDPQKMPVTVLSRCLQFNLKRLMPEQIEGQLKFILDAEGIEYQTEATELLARAADGSMRDGLSLLDQAIVHGNGGLNESDVLDMLGSVARQPVLDLLKALLSGQGSIVLDSVQSLDEFAPDYAEVLQSLLLFLHQIALCQISGIDNEDKSLTTLASQLSREDVQLYYQIGLLGQKDLPLAPSPKVGFEMVLLRMLAFAPAELLTNKAPASVAAVPQKLSAPSSLVQAEPESKVVERQATAPIANERTQPVESSSRKRAPKLTIPEKKSPENLTSVKTAPIPVLDRPSEPEKTAPVVVTELAHEWHQLVPGLGLDPMTLQLANNASLLRVDESECELLLMGGHVSLNKKSEEKLEQALSKYYGRRLQLVLTAGDKNLLTPNSILNKKVADRQQQAEDEVMSNTSVQEIIELFDGRVVEGSVKPID